MRNLFLTALVLMTLAFAAEKIRAENKSQDDELEITEHGSVRVEYGRYLLLKHDGDIFALHILANPRHGWDGITYRWYRLTNGTDEFFLPSPNRADDSSNRHIKTGAGQTHEGRRSIGIGRIQMDSLSIAWSKSNAHSGWLQLAPIAENTQLYPQQFSRIEDFSGKLNSNRWLSYENPDEGD